MTNIRDVIEAFKGTNADKEIVKRLRRAEELFTVALKAPAEEAEAAVQRYMALHDEEKEADLQNNVQENGKDARNAEENVGDDIVDFVPTSFKLKKEDSSMDIGKNLYPRNELSSNSSIAQSSEMSTEKSKNISSIFSLKNAKSETKENKESKKSGENNELPMASFEDFSDETKSIQDDVNKDPFERNFYDKMVASVTKVSSGREAAEREIQSIVRKAMRLRAYTIIK